MSVCSLHPKHELSNCIFCKVERLESTIAALTKERDELSELMHLADALIDTSDDEQAAETEFEQDIAYTESFKAHEAYRKARHQYQQSRKAGG